jgi:hypothetical protein
MVKPLHEIDWDRRYKNKAEQEFAQKAKTRGWMVTKCGHPDFICYRQDQEYMIMVEVKANKSQRLKKSQEKFMSFMSKHGIRCYKWSPDNDWMSEKNDRMWGNSHNNT